MIIDKTLEVTEISRTSHITNQKDLDRAGTKRQLMKVILKRQLKFLARCVMRRQHFENLCSTGKIEGIQARKR